MALTVILALAIGMAAVVYTAAPLFLGRPAPPLDPSSFGAERDAAGEVERAEQIAGLRAWSVAAGEVEGWDDPGVTTTEETDGSG